MLRKFTLQITLITWAISQVAPDYRPFSVEIPNLQLITSSISEDEIESPIEFKSLASLNITPEYFIWRLEIIFDQEYTGYIQISDWEIPDGAKLFIFDDDHSYTGPYLNHDETEFLSGRFKSNAPTFEYTEPINPKHPGDFKVSGIQADFPFSIISKKDNNQYIKLIATRENLKIMVTGYWPPTNEMVRHFSQNVELNPGGWQGENWEGLGYDVVSFFPEFDPPDCSDCGQGYGDLEVDYQDFSQDFWPIVADEQPVALITFSRGYNNLSWEIENRLVNRTNWYPDYTAPFLPTPNPPDNTVDSYHVRYSSLPIEEIINAVNGSHLGLDSYLDDTNAGLYLSEFAGYHGVWYKESNEDTTATPCFAGGHIHVGGQIDWDTAREAAELSIRTLIEYVDQFVYTPGDCNEDDEINILDIITLVNAILGEIELSSTQSLAADMDENGALNILDIIALINLILG